MSGTTAVNNSKALVVYKATERTPEELQFESTKQAVLNRSMELQKQAERLFKPQIVNIPQPLLGEIFIFLTKKDAPAVAATCKALQAASLYHLKKFAPNPIDVRLINGRQDLLEVLNEYGSLFL